MANEAQALQSIATMRDKLVVFNAVRTLAFSTIEPDEVVQRIREYYEAFDADHRAT